MADSRSHLIWTSRPSFLLLAYLCVSRAFALTGYDYVLDSEYSGANFFSGWDFYTGGDPTGGYVTFYSQSSAQLTGLINASANAPTYMGVDYNNILPVNGAGRPSVRISSQKSWTHGLFIGDFAHAPGGICGTWPAFWTLGPNWPYNGEIDILEGVNQLTQNAMSLHSNVNCSIAGDSSMETGTVQGQNCAYYVQTGGNGQGCGVLDSRSSSYGTGFNSIGGGVYAMQWTSDYIRVWFFARNAIPADITNLTPNPSNWGLPAGNLQGACNIDQRFQSHKIIFDNTFCGGYAGVPAVWNSTVNSCATGTGYSTCNAFVAAQPAAFQNAYWSINSVRVYQLSTGANSTTTPYVASLQPTSTVASSSSTTPPPSPTASLCPTYNYTVVQYGSYKYEIECGVNPTGSDLGRPYPSYVVNSFEDCVSGCSYWNSNNGSNTCGGVTYYVPGNACYWKKSVSNVPAAPGYNGARLVYYAYPQMADNPNAAGADTSATTTFVSTTVQAQYYSNPTANATSYTLTSGSAASSNTFQVGMGNSAASLTSSDTTSSVTSSASTSTSPLTTPFASTTPFSTVPSASTPVATTTSLGTLAAAAQSSTTPSIVSFSTTSSVSPSASTTSTLGTSTSSSSHAAWSSTSDAISTTTVLAASSSTHSTTGASTSSTTVPTIAISTSATTVTGHSSPSSISSIPVIATTPSASSVSSQASTSPPTTTSAAYSGNGEATLAYTPSSVAPQPQPSTLGQFVYGGCQGSDNGYEGFVVVEDSPTMSLDQCVSDCYNAAYAGIYTTKCYCAASVDAANSFIPYPDNECNAPCPGNPAESCGGGTGAESRLAVRQIMSGITVLTIYNNTLIVPGPNGLPTSSSISSAKILTTSTIPAISQSSATSISTVDFTPSGASGPIGPPSSSFSSYSISAATITPSNSMITTFVLGPSNSGTPTRLTLQPTPLSTIYIDVCEACEHGTSLYTFTMTTMHCGCTASIDSTGSTVSVASPTVPMITKVKQCTCGEGGRPSLTTLTVPDTSAITSLQSSWSAAGQSTPADEESTTQQSVPGEAPLPSVAPEDTQPVPAAGESDILASMSAQETSPIPFSSAAPLSPEGATNIHAGTAPTSPSNPAEPAESRSADSPEMTNNLASSAGLPQANHNVSAPYATTNGTTPVTTKTYTLQSTESTAVVLIPASVENASSVESPPPTGTVVGAAGPMKTSGGLGRFGEDRFIGYLAVAVFVVGVVWVSVF